MGESYSHYHNHQNPNNPNNQQLRQLPEAGGSSRLRSSGGEIVQVEGGHIVRSTGRKDRHSKVCTAKGPRDRRVRLSAHTAIQFYDVQDRLGYDRPSKAVDWLIKKAKTAIDELAELPAWKPTAISTSRNSRNPNSTSIAEFEHNPDQLNQFEQMGNSQNSSFLPPSLDSDSIADTIKSFFPMGTSSNPPNHNTSSDLRLSLQSFQDPIQQQPEQTANDNLYFDGSGWPENMYGNAVSGGFVFGSQPATTPFLQPLFGQTINGQFQRGPLQSSNTPSFRAWIDPPPPPPFAGGVGVDQHQTLAFHHHMASIPGFGSGLGGFSGFRVPARIQGEEEEHDGVSDRPSSASSDEHH